MGESSGIGKKILILIISNLLWGLIPIPSYYLMGEFSSFLIIFLRFLIMSIVLLVFTALLILKERKNDNSARIGFKDLFSYLKSKNHAFFALPQWGYLLILSIFGLNFLTIFYFIGLKFLGAIITSIGIMFSLIVSTLINWGMGKDRISNFKLLYLVTLVGAIVILILKGNFQEVTNSESTSVGFSILVVLMFGSALTFFIISGSTDKMASIEYKLLHKNSNYQIIRTVFKLGILSVFSTISLLILLIPLSFFSFPTIISSEIQGFWVQLNHFESLLKNPWFYMLVLGSTIIPYLIYYYTAATWPKNSSFDLWAGVLQLVEPIVSMLLGITLLNEIFPISWLLVIIFLLLIAIILKFISETEAQIYVVFFIKIMPQNLKNVQKNIMENREVKEIYNLIGEYDIYAYAQFSTSKSLNQFLLNIFQRIEGIQFYKMQIITDFALDRS